MITGTVLLLGLLFGTQHALEADHLAAVATLVAREKNPRRAIRQGVFWGLGHSLTLLLVGGVVMVIGVVLSERWVHGLEAAVGLMLVLLGLDLLRRLWRERVHIHVHSQSHEHRPLPLRALLVGMGHGLSGSAALVLLTLQQVRNPWVGLLYVLVFGIGSVFGMALLSWAVSVPMRLTAGHLARAHRALGVGVAVFSLGLGAHAIAGSWPG